MSTTSAFLGKRDTKVALKLLSMNDNPYGLFSSS
jgi:hypothetical protein